MKNSTISFSQGKSSIKRLAKVRLISSATRRSLSEEHITLLELIMLILKNNKLIVRSNVVCISSQETHENIDSMLL